MNRFHCAEKVPIFRHFCMRILGFDVSSSTIGYTVLEVDNENNIKPVKIAFYKPPKNGDIFDRMIETKREIDNIIKLYRPDHIAIEDIVQFMGGKSSAKTIITLAIFNRTVGLAAHEYLGHSPQLLSVMKIRHGLKFNKELPKKEDMADIIAKHLNIEFPFIYKKNNKIDSTSYDMADSAAVSLYYTLKLLNKIK